MSDIIIETQEINPSVIQVTVNNPMSQINITVQEPVAREEIHITVDPNAAQSAQNAAGQAQDILDEITGLISGVGSSFSYGTYTLYKAEVNNDPLMKNTLQPADTIAGLWSGNDYVDDGTVGIDIPKGTWIRAKYNGGNPLEIPNYSNVTF